MKIKKKQIAIITAFVAIVAITIMLYNQAGLSGFPPCKTSEEYEGSECIQNGVCGLGPCCDITARSIGCAAKIVTANAPAGECVYAECGGLCAHCGDGVCNAGEYENSCNCEEDCK